MAVDDRLSDLLVQWEQDRRNGIEPSLEDLCRETPDLLPVVRESINSLRATDWMFQSDANDSSSLDAAAAEAGRAALHDTELPASHLTVQEFAASIFQSGLLSRAEIDELKKRLDASALPGEAREIASRLVTEGKLTRYQAAVLLKASKDPLLVDNYVILDTLDTGGMGLVFKALHRSMNRVVALKLLPAAMMSARDTVKRFQREVQAAAALKHPNIVAAYDADESEEIAYLVLEYVEGTNLYRLVKERGPCTLAQAADYVRQAAMGVAYLHSRGIIHRDVKPANLILANDGTVKLLDMGLVRFASSEDLSCAEMDQELTQAGIVIGTVAYMSPEQALDTRSADQRSDIYSLGCTLFFLLTGRSLYHEETGMKTLLAHREQPVPSLREFCEEAPVSLDAVFRTMVAKRPADRLQSMDEVIAALDACVSSTGRAGRRVPSGPPPRIGPNHGRVWQSRRFRIAAAVTAIAAALIGGVYLAVIVIRIKTAQGTTEVSVNDPNAKIEITTKSQGPAPTQSQRPAGAKPPRGIRIFDDPFSTSDPAPKPGPLVRVVTATVRKGDFDVYLPDKRAIVRASQTVTVQSQVDGEINRVNFTEGQLVHKGDVLFEIDSRPYQLRVEEARAKLTEDKRLLVHAQLVHVQAELLVERKAIEKTSLGDKTQAVMRAEATLKKDQALVDEAQLQLSRCRIVAPISGRIGLRALDTGNMVQAAHSTRLATIAQFQPVDILFSIPQAQIASVQQKLSSTKEATVKIWSQNGGSEIATAQIVGLDNTVEPASGSISVKARAANDDNHLFPGESVSVRFLVNTLRDAAIVPTSAIEHVNGETFAFVVRPDQTVEKRFVVTGPDEKEQTIVKSGLSPGEIVVVQRPGELADGEKVELPNADAPETANSLAAPHQKKLMSIHFRNAPWTVVLAHFAAETNLTLSMQLIPSGVFNRWDSGRYSRGQTLAILNSELARVGCRLHVEGNVLSCTALRPGPAQVVNPKTEIKAASANAPPPPGSSDRSWAEWLLSHIPGCTLRTDLDPESVLFSVNELPPIEFHITRIGFTAQPPVYAMPPVDATLVRRLNELPALEAISFNPIPKTLVSALTSLTRLKSLSLQSPPELGEGPLKTIGDDSLETIGRMTSLEALRIESNEVTDAGLKNLAGLTRLTELFFSKARRLHGSGLKVLSALKLRVLGLPNSGIDDAGLAETARFPTLEEVNLSGTWISPKGLAPLAGLANLKQLDLGGCRRIDDSAFAQLAKLKHLRVLNLLNTRVTTDLIVELRSSLPDCSIPLPTQARKRTIQQQQATPKSR